MDRRLRVVTWVRGRSSPLLTGHLVRSSFCPYGGLRVPRCAANCFLLTVTARILLITLAANTMSIQVYDRARGTFHDEPQYGKKRLHFLYNTMPGRILLGAIFARPWYSNLNAVLN